MQQSEKAERFASREAGKTLAVTVSLLELQGVTPLSWQNPLP